jgi:hypothetical protein
MNPEAVSSLLFVPSRLRLTARMKRIESFDCSRRLVELGPNGGSEVIEAPPPIQSIA